MREYFIESERLRFSVWGPEDLPLAQELWGNPEVARYITASGRMTQEEILNRLNREMETYRSNGIQYFPLFLKESGRFAGCCGLRPYDEPTGLMHPSYLLRPGQEGTLSANEKTQLLTTLIF
ncbi:GNAT family N-acetyltransferase [Caproicibacter sp.]|uniref:GNAT family N-acetyltransferase n=1 Tax=Caproicibacter sp. TaxID=2814884 RepID=UPI00398A266B